MVRYCYSVLSLFLFPVLVFAQTTITVNTLEDEDNDDGDCSLREAIVASDINDTRDACPAGTGVDRIEFAVTGTIPVSFPPNISGEVIIAGPGAEDLLVEATGDNQIFFIQGGTATLSGMTIAKGKANANSGGGIVVFAAGTVHLADCVVRDNESIFDGGALYLEESSGTINNCTFHNNRTTGGGGGAILNLGGSLSITNSTFSENHANQDGGAVWSTNPGSQLTITNSTFSGNTANVTAGGVYVANGQGTLNNVTVSANTADVDADGSGEGGGVAVGNGATATFRNTIVAANQDASNEGDPTHDVVNFGTIATAGFNVVGDGTGAPEFVHGTNNDQVGSGSQPLDPRLGPLEANDGGTLTHALLYNSPALNGGACTDNTGATVTTDQRGFARPEGGTCDIGAFERRPADARTAVEDADLPTTFTLSEVYPNPFNPQAQFTLEVAQTQHVRVVVFDILGREVDMLHTGALAGGALHRFTLNAAAWTSGSYLIRIVGDTFTETRRVMLVK